jgi:hypothetical protein
MLRLEESKKNEQESEEEPIHGVRADAWIEKVELTAQLKPTSSDSTREDDDHGQDLKSAIGIEPRSLRPENEAHEIGRQPAAQQDCG